MVSFIQRRFGLRQSDVVLALFVVAIAAMLLVPLPTALLDILLVINISFSLLLLMVGLYMPNALALLSFPSILLLTTLFRLGLNVASTRLILSQGDAGQVIQAFGTFLISGEIVVGVIIFTIITIVNFIVVAKGSSRVSEVAARFALDALPGKQMAIDSDLRAGLLSPREAEVQRELLRKESQLFGSMDGAMKFVQGDAIAGFFIIIANIVGGLYLGMSNGLSFGEAVQTYTVLTVGDGLVSQIPALLISICAGIVVTRVASSEQSTLGSDVGAQVFKRSGSVLFAGILLIFIALLPGLPAVPFAIVGLAFIASGIVISRTPGVVSGPGGESALIATPLLPVAAQEAAPRLSDAPLVVSLDASTLYRLFQHNEDFYRTKWAALQDSFFDAVGLRLPDLLVSPERALSTHHFSVSINSSRAFSGTVPLDALMVELAPVQATIMGLQVALNATHPLTGHRTFWVQRTAAAERVIFAANLRAWDWVEFIFMQIANFYHRHPEEVLGMSDTLSRLKEVEKRFPGLVSEGLRTDFISAARMTEILQELVREGVAIRNFRAIIEAIASYCSSYGMALVEENEFDLHDIVGYVRLQRKRQFLADLLSRRETLRVVTLSDEVENLLTQASFENSQIPLPLERGDYQQLEKGLHTVVDPVFRRGLLPVSVLCRSEIRHRVISFLRFSETPLRVVTHEELEPAFAVEQVGVWAPEVV